MIPSSVKNDRSLWLHTVCRACRMASVNCMAGKLTARSRGRGRGKGPSPLFPLLSSPAAYRLFVSQRFYWIQPRGPTGGVETESHAGQGRGAECDGDRPQGHVGGNRGDTRDRERDAASHQHARRAAHQRQRSLVRSEEHTSELQSQSNLVCRLLLEKKKKKVSSRLCGS